MVEEDEYCITDDVETNIKNGDLFQLGEHRLICGDCLDSNIMSTLMQEDTASMVFTDPPYLMDLLVVCIVMDLKVIIVSIIGLLMIILVKLKHKNLSII